MSVYSGFATRQQEHKYNNLIETLVIAIKKRLIKFYAGEVCDQDKFKLLLKKIYKKMYILEKGKYMAPKFTTCYTDLIDNLNIEINYDTMSDASSMMSQTFSLRKESMDADGDQLRSNALLNNKRNLMEVKPPQKFMNTSTLSLKRNNNLLGKIDNEEEQMKPMFLPRSKSLDPVEEHFQRNKSKFAMKDVKNLRELRGTINMPRVEDFLPRKEEIQPIANHVKRNLLVEHQPAHNSPKQVQNNQPKVVFRRQKYMKIQDI